MDSLRFTLAPGWLFLVTLSPAAAAAGPGEFNHAKLAETARTSFIIPGYRRFGEQLQTLKTSIVAHCQSPSRSKLEHVRETYRRTITAWGRVEIISFGPIAEANRFERIFYWPDRKGIGRRQVRRLLAARQKGVLEPDRLTSKSVAVQGLSALKLMLYGADSDDFATGKDGGFACLYASAVAHNLSRIIAKILEGWQHDGAFAKLWRSPGPENVAYLKPNEMTLELVKALDHGLENLRDRRIAPVLGFGANRRRKSRPVLWRSKLSMVLISANIAGLRDLLFEGGLARAYVDSKPYQDERAQGYMLSIKRDFKMLFDRSERLAREPDPLARRDVASRLVPIGFPLKSIRHRAVSEIKTAAGLSIGFNAADGD